MNKEDIQRIVTGYFRKLKKCIQEILPGFEAEQLHQFRVEYKKLRAFLRMLSLRDNDKEKPRLSKNLKKAYHLAGSIRDLQLQKKSIVEAVRPDQKKARKYFNQLQREIKNLEKELSEVLDENPVSESKKKTVTMLPGKFQAVDFRHFMQTKRVTLKNMILAGDFRDDRIHSIRKLLKDIFYSNKQITGENDKSIPGQWKEKNESYYKVLLEDLGNFQDRCRAILLLKPYWLRQLNTTNQMLLCHVKETWIKDKLAKKRKLVSKLKKDFLSLPVRQVSDSVSLLKYS
ncbi:MAG: domain containing protein [Chitinophagaceae bacterium]|nr:domain containing protein [Chitinophagaceae bacterium]